MYVMHSRRGYGPGKRTGVNWSKGATPDRASQCRGVHNRRRSDDRGAQPSSLQRQAATYAGRILATVAACLHATQRKSIIVTTARLTAFARRKLPSRLRCTSSYGRKTFSAGEHANSKARSWTRGTTSGFARNLLGVASADGI